MRSNTCRIVDRYATAAARKKRSESVRPNTAVSNTIEHWQHWQLWLADPHSESLSLWVFRPRKHVFVIAAKLFSFALYRSRALNNYLARQMT